MGSIRNVSSTAHTLEHRFQNGVFLIPEIGHDVCVRYDSSRPSSIRHRESIAKRLERDLEAMTALPGAPFDACHQAAGQVSSQSLVRYHNNDYSVPVAYGYRQVWVRGYVDRVVIGCGAEVNRFAERRALTEAALYEDTENLLLIGFGFEVTHKTERQGRIVVHRVQAHQDLRIAELAPDSKADTLVLVAEP